MSKILIVDDERDILDLIRMHLEHDGHVVVEAANGIDALKTAISESPDLIVLDWMLPGLDGLSAFKRLRIDSRTRDIPVILLTAKAQQADRLTGLELGADDYLTKPFSPRELLLRVNAVLRRVKKVTTTSETKVGDYTLDRKNLVLLIGTERYDLTSIEFKLLAVLMENPDVTHERGELLQGVWGYQDDTATRTLDTHVKRLREKLGPHGERIVTVRGQGYGWKQ
jgi:two-component system, OmpR family, phosphate regulon response regulator PhoB